MARRLTLTFDNGPDPELAPHVLDTLAFDAVAAGAIIVHADTGLDSHAIAAVATQGVGPGQASDLVSSGHFFGNDLRTDMAGPAGGKNVHVTDLGVM